MTVMTVKFFIAIDNEASYQLIYSNFIDELVAGAANSKLFLKTIMFCKHSRKHTRLRKAVNK